MTRAIAIAAAALAIELLACDGDRLALTSAEPPYAPVLGGTRVVLHGAGFGAVGDPIGVLVGGRQAVLATVIDDSRVEILVPPGERPGDAEVTVLGGEAYAHATGILHYSTPPTIDGVSTRAILYNAQSTRVYVSGHGFMDEGAGLPHLTLEGGNLSDVTATDDDTLTFLVAAGTPMVEPDLEIENNRGTGVRARLFRYLPSERPGLLLFPWSGNSFAVYFDPATRIMVPVPWVATFSSCFFAVMHDHDDYWGLGCGGQFGRIDFTRQRLESPITTFNYLPAMVRHRGVYYAIDGDVRRFGRFDPSSGGFTPIGTETLPCCGPYSLASDGDLVYLVDGIGTEMTLTTIDPRSGGLGLGLPLLLPADTFIMATRSFGGTLYGVTREPSGNGALVTIDRESGAVTKVLEPVLQVSAMEVYP